MTANPVNKSSHQLSGNTISKLASLGLVREASVVEA